MRSVLRALASVALVIPAAAVLTVPIAASTVTAASAADASTLGTTAATAAGSCWEIKQVNSAATDGAYWLQTPAMTEPAQFYCDMTTDGGGWVLIGKGRDGWVNDYEGKGSVADLLTPDLATMSSATTQLPSTTVDALLDKGRVDALADGIRLRRATNGGGTSWQESRFKLTSRDRWVWTFGAEHTVGTWSFGTTTGSGGQTAAFGADQSYNQVYNTTNANQTPAAGPSRSSSIG